jgi:8-oxo-dGTP diphosphatase
MKRYTICFIKCGDRLLMLNRVKKPVMGLWNGVGGKIEEGETPEQGAIREIREETGLEVAGVTSRGVVKWVDGNLLGEGHLFLAEIEHEECVKTPALTTEGILDWRDIDWVLDWNNQGVVPTIPVYLPDVLFGHTPTEHIFYYREGDCYKVEQKTASE